MKVKNVHMGIHAIELYAGKLKYQQVQKTIDHLVDQGSIQQIYSDAYSIGRHLKSAYLVEETKSSPAFVRKVLASLGL